MRRLSVIALLTLAFSARALITNNLVADYRGGVGITAVSNRVAQWDDQHNLLNNDGVTNNLTQPTAANRPWDFTDPQGNRGVMFPWGTGSQVPHPHATLSIPATLSGLNATSLTVYIVATGPSNPDQPQTLISFAGLASGWIRFVLSGTYPQNFPLAMSVGTRGSSLHAPLNPAVFVAMSDNSRTTLRWNNAWETNAAQAGSLTGGGVLGAGASEYYSGIVYRVLIYKAAHTTAQVDAQVAELSAQHGVLTNYTQQAVCRGDSITAGVDCTLLQSYPFQLWERYPEIKWFNVGIGGMKIGPSGNNDTMYVMDPNFVDTLFDPALDQNWLFFWGGVNDINSDGINGQTAFNRLTNYVAARKAAHPWRVVVSTVQPSIQDSVKKGEFNACIRTNASTANYDGYVDPGYQSPIETRLNSFTDTNYFFTDQLHLINAGQGVIADHIGQVINVPHRTTGFFGP